MRNLFTRAARKEDWTCLLIQKIKRKIFDWKTKIALNRLFIFHLKCWIYSVPTVYSLLACILLYFSRFICAEIVLRQQRDQNNKQIPDLQCEITRNFEQRIQASNPYLAINCISRYLFICIYFIKIPPGAHIIHFHISVSSPRLQRELNWIKKANFAWIWYNTILPFA